MKFSRLPRAARIGALAGIACVLPLSPFLAYAGLAIANVSAQWAGGTSQSLEGRVVGVVIFVVWLLLVFGVPGSLGLLLGVGYARRHQRRGA
jgi:hypothetical protein